VNEIKCTPKGVHFSFPVGLTELRNAWLKCVPLISLLISSILFIDTLHASKIYEGGSVVGAVCHGPAGLVNIKLSNGDYLDKVVPFLLEDKLSERGATFEKSGLWQPHVTVDKRLVTGQNPQSAKGVGEAVLEELNKLKQ
jgi:DJ-1/PfpI family